MLRQERRPLHIEIIMIYKLSSSKFTTQNDLDEYYYSKCVVVLIETKFIDYECLQMTLTSTLNPKPSTLCPAVQLL